MKERKYLLWPWMLLASGLVLSSLEAKWVYPLHHNGYGAISIRWRLL